MRYWIEKIKWKFQIWMRGRYGLDELSSFLSRAALVLILVSIFLPWDILSMLAVGSLLWSLFRICSQNPDKRKRELDTYQRIKCMPVQWIELQKHRQKDREHRYFRCSCGTILRMPRGKGKIDVICPNCQQHSVHRS